MTADPNVELKFKEILYCCLEDLKATKASVYLLEPDGDFHLKASYGFSRTDAVPELHPKATPLVEALYMERKPFYINSLADAGGIRPLLANSNTTRILISPIYVERIAGFLDIRDKAGKAPFDDHDIRIADGIALRFSQTLSVDRRKKEAPPILSVDEVPQVTNPVFMPPTGDELYDRVAALVLTTDARNFDPLSPPPSSLQASCCKLIDLAFSHPDFLNAVFSLYTESGCYMVTGGRQALPRDLLLRLAADGRAWVAPKVRIEPGRSHFIHNHFPQGEADPHPNPHRALSAALALQETGAVLFNYFTRRPLSREEVDGLGGTLTIARTLVRLELDAASGRQSLMACLEKLIEPGLENCASLKIHSLEVEDLTRAFAAYLRMEPKEVERLALAGLLHDVGMRELDYARLYHKMRLTDEDLRLLQQHPRVGAYLLQDIPLPGDLCSIILHHHERWDGGGYPDRLAGEEIPHGARLIHIVEAYQAMTSKASYRPSVEPGQALAILRSKAGVQFDPSLIDPFTAFLQAHEKQQNPGSEP
jgi:hypothetical protein